MVQMSFVLEMPPSARAREAAKRFAELHGLNEPLVATMEECAEGYSFFVVYGHSQHAVDVAPIDVPEVRTEALSREEIEHRDQGAPRAQDRRGRRVHRLATRTPSASTRSSTTRATRATRGSRATRASRRTTSARRSRTSSSPRARGRSSADAILVSQVITQRNCHKENGRARRARREPGLAARRHPALRRAAHRSQARARARLRRRLRSGHEAGRRRVVPRRADVRRRAAARSLTHRPRAVTAGCAAGGAPAVFDHVLDRARGRRRSRRRRSTTAVTACTVFAPWSIADSDLVSP